MPFPCQVWINQGDIILVGLRDFEPSKADVLLKYTADEARNLKTYGELPENGLSLSPSWFCLPFIDSVLQPRSTRR